MGLEGEGIVNVPSPQFIDLVDLEGGALLPLKFLLRRLAEDLDCQQLEILLLVLLTQLIFFSLRLSVEWLLISHYGERHH